MTKIIYIKLLILVMSSCSLYGDSFEIKSIKTLMIDTTHIEKQRCEPFISIAKVAGFEIDYKGIDSFLDGEVDVDDYDALIVDFGSEFLKGLGRSFVSARLLKFIQKFSRTLNVSSDNSERLIIFSFPGLRARKGVGLVRTFNPIFSSVGLGANSERLFGDNAKSFLKDVNIFLGVPLESRAIYHTTLKLQKRLFLDVSSMLDKTDLSSFALPLKQNVLSTVKYTLPYGILGLGVANGNNIFVTFSTLLSFSSIAENFHFCPARFTLRHDIYKSMLRTLFELNLLVQQKKITDKGLGEIGEEITPQLPVSISNIGKKIKTLTLSVSSENSSSKSLSAGSNGLRKIGWMELNCFEDLKEESVKRQKRLINSIYESGLDTLWITFNPNYYYSPIGIKKKEKKKLLTTVSRFTRALKESSVNLKLTVPKILVGFEIANNIYKPNLPKDCSADLYGNKYPDLPSPFNKSFWNNEIEKPLLSFLRDWSNSEISNGIKLSGVVLDLEMYCRKQTGSFLDTFGFNNKSINAFNNVDASWWRKIKTFTLRSRTKRRSTLIYLSDKKQVCSYFQFLTNEARELGQNLRNLFEKSIPGCIVCAYAPNISTSWFYKGFYSGLSDGKNINLFTFNSEFASHEAWLEQNNIFSKHYSVLLLSKLREKKDFKWVDYIFNHHDGIWLNRFSRFAEKYDRKSWCFLEQTPLNNEKRSEFLAYLESK